MTTHIPTSSAEIPAGTGLVQTVECKGKQYGPEGGPRFIEPLNEPVSAELTTFANGVRRVCCLHASDPLNSGKFLCRATSDEGKESGCKYAWKDSTPSKR